MEDNFEWLKHQVEHYQAEKTDACEAVDDFDEFNKLRLGVTSANLGDGSVPRPTLMIKVIFGNSYVFETTKGEHSPKTINGRYLKKCFPSVW